MKKCSHRVLKPAIVLIWHYIFTFFQFLDQNGISIIWEALETDDDTSLHFVHVVRDIMSELIKVVAKWPEAT